MSTAAQHTTESELHSDFRGGRARTTVTRS